jgi:hypothetical protein
VLIPTGDAHEAHRFPVQVISHASFDGLFGIAHTQKILGSHAPSRDLL